MNQEVNITVHHYGKTSVLVGQERRFRVEKRICRNDDSLDQTRRAIMVRLKMMRENCKDLI